MAEAKSKLLQLQGHMLSDKAKHALGDALSEIPTAQDPGMLVNLALARAEVAEHEHHVKLAEAKEKERQAMMRQLYENDAKLRADIDEIMRDVQAGSATFDKDQRELDRAAKENGFTTSCDEARDEVEAELRDLEKRGVNPNAEEYLKARMKRAAIIELQSKERAEKAEKAGKPELAEQYRKNESDAREEFDRNAGGLDRVMSVYLEAIQRQLEKENDPKMVEKLEAMKKGLEERKAIQDPQALLQTMKKELQEVLLKEQENTIDFTVNHPSLSSVGVTGGKMASLDFLRSAPPVANHGIGVQNASPTRC